MLEGLKRLVSGKELWNQQRNGIVLFLGPGFRRGYRVPRAFEELVVVAPTFHTRPFVDYLAFPQRSYVLEHCHKRVQIWEGSPDAVQPVPAGSVPRDLVDALHYQFERVRLLLTEEGRRIWGTVDRETGRTKVLGDGTRAPAPEAVKLLDELTGLVLPHGGEVVPISRSGCRRRPGPPASSGSRNGQPPSPTGPASTSGACPARPFKPFPRDGATVADILSSEEGRGRGPDAVRPSGLSTGDRARRGGRGVADEDEAARDGSDLLQDLLDRPSRGRLLHLGPVAHAEDELWSAGPVQQILDT